MTSRPIRPHVVHSGFLDLVDLVSQTTSKIGLHTSSSRFLSGLPNVSEERAPLTRDWRAVAAGQGRGRGGDNGLGIRYEDQPARPNVDPNVRGVGRSSGGKSAVAKGYGGQSGRAQAPLKYRKVDKRDIGHPTDFRHVLHASTFEEATELLLRWSIEGVGDKIGDPSWSDPIKQLVKARAKEQQALAVAQVVEATAWSKTVGRASKDKVQPGQLHVVNGMPSSIYSTTNNTITPRSAFPPGLSPLAHVASSGYFSPSSSTARPQEPSVSALLAGAETPTLIAHHPAGGFFEAVPSLSLEKRPISKYPANPFQPRPALQPIKTTVTPRSPDLAKTTSVSVSVSSRSMAPPPPPNGPRAQLRRRISPIQIRKKSLPPPPAESDELAYMAAKDGQGGALSSSPPMAQAVPEATKEPESPNWNPPFRIVEPTLPTLERAMSIALFFEQYYHALLKPSSTSCATNMTSSAPAPAHPGNYVLSRARRLAVLEADLQSEQNRHLSDAEKADLRSELIQEENRLLRERRRKVDVRAFETGRVIGHGAFGVVRIAREKQTGRLVAMKQLRKADMLRKSQEGHVRAEKDVLAAAATQSLSSSSTSWIVKLYYAFQDVDNLYLVLEYMGGGDLLNLLVALDTFSEDMTKFYVAEMVLALAETHRLGYIHRDIKPDNFLFTPEGHVRISDFGLSTDLHWAHDTHYYEHQRQALLKKHGVDLEYPMPNGTAKKRLRKQDVERILGKEWVEQGSGVLSWRDKNRKRLAYSVCGTNSYMAPEVIRGQGYGFSCDWWSLGVIMYEALYGYPPFVSNSRHVTRQKILNWKTTLKFPPGQKISKNCIDFMTRLLCEPEDRLGSSGNVTRPSVLTIKGSAFSIRTGPGGLGSDGVEDIKAHPWFAEVDWDNMHRITPPYNPSLDSEDDTRHFDEDIPSEPLAPGNGASPSATKDPLLSHRTQGKQLLEIRKELAFKGWTFKSPQAVMVRGRKRSDDKRYGHMAYISSGGQSDVDSEPGADKGDQSTLRDVRREMGGGDGDAEGWAERMMGMDTVRVRGGTVRGRALSF